MNQQEKLPLVAPPVAASAQVWRQRLDALDSNYEVDQLAALLLASVEELSPARMRRLCDGGASTLAVLDALWAGHLPLGSLPLVGVTGDTVKGWGSKLRAIPIADLAARHRQAGVQILTPNHRRWPFRHDPEPPIMLAAQGRVDLLGAQPNVAIVGTRSCTTHGRRVAAMLGTELTEAGINVVSGLASGIDGAAHGGALSALESAPAGSSWGPIGVVASGLDVVYPKRNAAIWHQVAQRGLLLSEVPLGVKPIQWRFPARNRIVASLADVVVVVESHIKGGSMHTVDAAIARGTTVMAVPGSILNKAAAGTNRLLVDGCAPVTGTEDVIDVLRLQGWSGERPLLANDDDRCHDFTVGGDTCTHSAGEEAGSKAPDSLTGQIVREAEGGSVHVDDLAASLGAPIPAVLAAVDRLVRRGRISLDGSIVLPATNQ